MFGKIFFDFECSKCVQHSLFYVIVLAVVIPLRLLLGDKHDFHQLVLIDAGKDKLAGPLACITDNHFKFDLE